MFRVQQTRNRMQRSIHQLNTKKAACNLLQTAFSKQIQDVTITRAGVRPAQADPPRTALGR